MHRAVRTAASDEVTLLVVKVWRARVLWHLGDRLTVFRTFIAFLYLVSIKLSRLFLYKIYVRKSAVVFCRTLSLITIIAPDGKIVRDR